MYVTKTTQPVSIQVVITLLMMMSFVEHVFALTKDPTIQLGSATIQTRIAEHQLIDGGIAYIFARGANGDWSLEAELDPPNHVRGNKFGFSVSIDGDTAVVGAPDDDDQAIDAGAVYVFERTADGRWRQQAKLYPSDGHDGDHFGYALAVNRGLLLVGAPDDDQLAADAGAVYVFVRRPDGSWTLQRELRPPQTSMRAGHFGESISVEDNGLLISIRNRNNMDANFSSAYFFARDLSDAWFPQFKLITAFEAFEKEFGVAVNMDGDTAVIGQAGKNGISGVAYVLSRGIDGTWIKEAELRCGRDVHETFGFSVFLKNDVVIIGAPSDR